MKIRFWIAALAAAALTSWLLATAPTHSEPIAQPSTNSGICDEIKNKLVDAKRRHVLESQNPTPQALARMEHLSREIHLYADLLVDAGCVEGQSFPPPKTQDVKRTPPAPATTTAPGESPANSAACDLLLRQLLDAQGRLNLANQNEFGSEGEQRISHLKREVALYTDLLNDAGCHDVRSPQDANQTPDEDCDSLRGMFRNTSNQLGLAEQEYIELTTSSTDSDWRARARQASVRIQTDRNTLRILREKMAKAGCPDIPNPPPTKVAVPNPPADQDATPTAPASPADCPAGAQPSPQPSPRATGLYQTVVPSTECPPGSGPPTQLAGTPPPGTPPGTNFGNNPPPSPPPGINFGNNPPPSPPPGINFGNNPPPALPPVALPPIGVGPKPGPTKAATPPAPLPPVALAPPSLPATPPAAPPPPASTPPAASPTPGGSNCPAGQQPFVCQYFRTTACTAPGCGSAMQSVPFWQTFCRPANQRAQAEKDCKALNGTLETQPTIAVKPKPAGMPLAVLPVDPPPVHVTPSPPGIRRPGHPPRINIVTTHPPHTKVITHPPRTKVTTHPPRINRPGHPPRVNRPGHPPRVTHPQRTHTNRVTSHINRSTSRINRPAQISRRRH